MGLFRPPVGAISTADASTLNGKLEEQLSVYNSQKLNNIDASEYTQLDYPEPTTEKQVLYRVPLENKISNGSFDDNLDGWSFEVYGGITSYLWSINDVTYHSAPGSCDIYFDTTGLGSDEMGVLMTQTVDLTGVDQISFYAKETSESEYYNDISVSDFYIGETFIGLQVTGKYGGSSGRLDDKWRLCYTETIPTALKVPNQTLTFNFKSGGWDMPIQFVVDDFVAYGTPSDTVAWISDINDYIDDEIDVHLESPASSSSRQFLYRDSHENRIPSGNMERDDPYPWEILDSDDELSIDTSTYHSGSRSLKVLFDVPYDGHAYPYLDYIDLTNVDEISFYIYGGANCVSGVVNVAIGSDDGIDYPFASNKWTKIIFEVPENRKVINQILYLGISCTPGNNIEVFIDDVTANASSSLSSIYRWAVAPVYHGVLDEPPNMNVLDGDEYYNTGDSKFYKYNGSSWIALN